LILFIEIAFLQKCYLQQLWYLSDKRLLSIFQDKTCCKSDWNSSILPARISRQVLSEAWDLCHCTHSIRRWCCKFWMVWYSFMFGWPSFQSKWWILVSEHNVINKLPIVYEKTVSRSWLIWGGCCTIFFDFRVWLKNTKRLLPRLLFAGAFRGTLWSFLNRQKWRGWKKTFRFLILSCLKRTWSSLEI